jgi:hypothetical protein
MGGVYLLLAAMLRPDQFEAIVLVAPSGLLRHDSFFGLVGRLNRKVLLSIKLAVGDPSLRMATWVSIREGLRYALTNPWRAYQEARSLPGIQTRSWIEALRKRGMKVYVVLAADDVIYPMDQIDWVYDVVDGFDVLDPGQHDAWFYPDRLARAIRSLIGSATPAPGGFPQ